jgi:hypothetical protein
MPKKQYDAIQQGDPVTLLTYTVGLIPDGAIEDEYEPFAVHLRFRPEVLAGQNVLDPKNVKVSEGKTLADEILARAIKIERREHYTLADTEFTLGTVKFIRERQDVAK